LLELKRVTSPLRLRHLRYPFALEQLAKGYVLRGQGQTRNRSLSKDRATEIAATVSRYVQRTQITHPGEPICHC
jgi:hypothetical protein